MSASGSIRSRIQKLNKKFLYQFTVSILVIILLIGIPALIYYSQVVAERGALEIATSGERGTSEQKGQYEIAKLAAEIRQIRSDTSGSLFWLKLLGLVVTVVSAVSGYLLGQRQNTQKRIEFERENNQKRMDFEHRKDIDAAYQSVVQGLSDQSSVLRATAAVKLGAILKDFPKEWNAEEERQQQMIRLTKEVLAAALAIESDPKVLKTLSIALVLHKPFQNDPPQQDTDLGPPLDMTRYADARELDLSGAKANDAYWAKVDFSSTDFYNAQLAGASLRSSLLSNVQFYSANLSGAVLSRAKGKDLSFKLSDLRNADLTDTTLKKPNFEGAKVCGVKLTGAILELEEPLDVEVDNSNEGDGSQMMRVRDWLERTTRSQQPKRILFVDQNHNEIVEPKE